MVGLRKSWFNCSVSWLLIVWMLLSPLALLWHLALSPNHGIGCETSCHADSTLALSATPKSDQRSNAVCPEFSACPYGHDNAVALQSPVCCPENPLDNSPSNDSSGTDHHCPICELLSLDDVWVMQWEDIPRTLQFAQDKVLSGIFCLPNRLVLPWNVRGPPNLA